MFPGDSLACTSRSGIPFIQEEIKGRGKTNLEGWKVAVKLGLVGVTLGVTGVVGMWEELKP